MHHDRSLRFGSNNNHTRATRRSMWSDSPDGSRELRNAFLPNLTDPGHNDTRPSQDMTRHPERLTATDQRRR